MEQNIQILVITVIPEKKILIIQPNTTTSKRLPAVIAVVSKSYFV